MSAPISPTKLDDRQNHLRDVAEPSRLTKVCYCTIIAGRHCCRPFGSATTLPACGDITAPLLRRSCNAGNYFGAVVGSYVDPGAAFDEAAAQVIDDVVERGYSAMLTQPERAAA